MEKKTFGSQNSPIRSGSVLPTELIAKPYGASCGFNESGALGNNSNGQESESSARSTPDSVLWRFWDAGSERSYHGAPAIVELGEI
jgi:hypothetical protein